MKTVILAFLLLAVKALAHDNVPGAVQKKPVALIHARIYTMTNSAPQSVLEDATVVFDNGKIGAIGKNVEVPAGAEVIDCTGKSVYPGFISAFSSLGLVEIEAVRATRDVAEAGEFNPNSLAATAYNPDSEIIPTVRSNGVLIANVVPEGGVVSGRMSLMMLDGWTREDCALSPVAGLNVQFPSMVVSTSPWMQRSPEEQRKENEKRMRALDDFFSKAKSYSTMAQAGLTEEEKDIRMEAMRQVFEKRLPVFFNADEYKQIAAAIDFAKKYSLNAVIVGGKDSWRLTRELRSASIPVVIQRTHALPMRDEEAYDLLYSLPAKLHDAGIMFAFADEGAWQQRNLPFQAGTAVAFGLSEEEAIRALTINAARILGVADRVGSLETGKDATLFVSNGNALDALTNELDFAFIQGRKVDLSSKQTRLSEKYRMRYRQQK